MIAAAAHPASGTEPATAADSRARGFDGESVKLDAIPVRTLRAMVRDVIEPHIDEEALLASKELEAADRRILDRFVKRVRKSA